MCSNCAKILIDFSIKHTPEACPLKASLMCTYCNKKGHSYSSCTEKHRQTTGLLPRTTEQRTRSFVPTLNMRQEDASMGAFLRMNNVIPCLKEDPVARRKKNNELVQECATTRYKLTIIATPFKKKNPL